MYISIFLFSITYLRNLSLLSALMFLLKGEEVASRDERPPRPPDNRAIPLQQQNKSQAICVRVLIR